MLPTFQLTLLQYNVNQFSYRIFKSYRRTKIVNVHILKNFKLLLSLIREN